MKKYLIAVFCGMLAFLATDLSAMAEKQSLNPADRCIDVLQIKDRNDAIMVGLWAFGYVSKSTGQYKKVTPQNNKKVLQYLAKLCKRDPEKSFGKVVEQFASLLTNAKSSSKDARNVIRKFMAPNADYVALTRALFPTEKDVRTVFADPVASRLVAFYAKAFKPGIKIRPKPEHTDFLSWQSTTGKLKAGDPMLQKFAGGIKKVAPYYIADVPIARFKFVKSGETLGLVFDSLYFVNGRWVFMPKPWRALK